MAVKREKPKPLNALRFDFAAAVDNVMQEGIMLLNAIEMASRHGKITGPVKGVLDERAAKFRAALFEDLKLKD